MSRFRKSVTHLLASAGAAAVLWLIPGAAASSGATRLLSVSIAGSGGVVTTADGRINCGTTCSAAYRRGKVLRLTASASTSFLFIRWTEIASGPRRSATLRSTGQRPSAPTSSARRRRSGLWRGPGRVVSTPAGISCGGGGDMCANLFEHGSTVALTRYQPPTADSAAGTDRAQRPDRAHARCGSKAQAPKPPRLGHLRRARRKPTLTVAHYGPPST